VSLISALLYKGDTEFREIVKREYCREAGVLKENIGIEELFAQST
jgi:hypothetical protein